MICCGGGSFGFTRWLPCQLNTLSQLVISHRTHALSQSEAALVRTKKYANRSVQRSDLSREVSLRLIQQLLEALTHNCWKYRA